MGYGKQGTWDLHQVMFVTGHHFYLLPCIGHTDLNFSNNFLMGYIGKKLEEAAIINSPVKRVSKFMYRWLTKAILCIPGNPLGFTISG